MSISKETKLFLIFFAIYFYFAWILTFNYYLTHYQHIPDRWQEWHQSIAQRKINDSNQFRLLSFWLANIASKAFSQPIYVAYLIVRFFFTFFTFCIFHLFLLKWFDHQKAFLSVVLLAAITPITYLPYLQESDVIIQFFFLVGFWLIREKKLLLITALIFLATFAKETILFLVPFYFLLYWQNNKKSKIIIHCLLFCFIWLGAFYITRYAFYQGQNSPLWQLPHNIKQITNYFKYNPLTNISLLFLPLFSIFWFLPFVRLKEKPYFFRKAAPYIIIFFFINFLFGWPEETRILLPLAFLIIPSGIMSLFPQIMGGQ